MDPILYWVGLLSLGFMNSLMLAYGRIVSARGHLVPSVIMSFINVAVWFLVIKIGVEITLVEILFYAGANAAGAGLAVHFTRKLVFKPEKS